MGLFGRQSMQEDAKQLVVLKHRCPKIIPALRCAFAPQARSPNPGLQRLPLTSMPASVAANASGSAPNRRCSCNKEQMHRLTPNPLF